MMIRKDPVIRKLTSYVNEQIPKLITLNPLDLKNMGETFTPEDLIKVANLDSSEIVDSFRLSLITESLTEQYSQTFKIGAKTHGADWLENYISGFWEPDELGHADPIKNILIALGIDKSSIEYEIQYAKESTNYYNHHKSGFHPVQLTTYGMIQECITDYWYGLQRGLFPRNSKMSQIISKVKGREALHTVQFRNLTAIQIDADPELLDNVIYAILNFHMPANEIEPVKEIESKTQEWIPKMNGEVIELLRKIIFNLSIALDDKDKLGKLFTKYASSSDHRFIKFIPNSFLSQAIDRIRPGYGIVGEIVLEELGLISDESQVP